MIKQIGKFNMSASAQCSWLKIDGGPSHISLSKEDLLDLRYAADFALRVVEWEEKKLALLI